MPHEALRALLPIAGWSADEAGAVTFSGGSDPVLPTPFRIGTAAAATLAASGLAASRLWEARTGRRQRVAVNLRHAAASLRSGHYMRLGDGKVSAARNTIMGVYPSRDGRWSYLHCNFPNHRAAALKVLGVAEDREVPVLALAGRAPGAGLGLPIARALTELHGGTIELNSVPGRGTDFVVTLPEATDEDSDR